MESTRIFKSSKEVRLATQELAENVVAHLESESDLIHEGIKGIVTRIQGEMGVAIIYDPECLYSYKANQDFLNSIQPVSRLFAKLRLNNLIQGKLRFRTLDPIGKVIIVPLFGNNTLQGVILIKTGLRTGLERDFLVRAGEVLGRYIYIKKNATAAFNRVSQIGRKIQEMQAALGKDPRTDLAHHQIGEILAGFFHCRYVILSFFEDTWSGIMMSKIFDAKKQSWDVRVNLNPDTGILGEVLRTGKQLWVNQPSNHPAYDRSVDGVGDKDPEGLLYAPYYFLDQVRGCVAMVTEMPGGFSEDDHQQFLLTMTYFSSLLQSLEALAELRVAKAEQAATEWELTRSRNILRAMFDHMPYSLYIINQDYQLLAVNMVRARRVAQEPKQLIGRHCFEVLYQLTSPCPGCLVHDTFKSGKFTHRKQRELNSMDQITEWVIETYPITNDESQVSHAILFEQDVTENRKLEEILAQSEKLTAVGQLASGLSHEINNPLAVIMANAQLLLKELPENEEWKESLYLILRAGTRAQQVVRNLESFASKEEYKLIPTNLYKTIHFAIRLIEHEIVGREINLGLENIKEVPPVLASPDHLQGVWLNILINAMDAMKPGSLGRIAIRAAYNEERDEVLVAIEDNGQGIPAEKLSRIFEPFYTTKDSKQRAGSTGLGLSICYQIIKQHGGDIYVESQMDVGTTFTVILPSAVHVKTGD